MKELNINSSATSLVDDINDNLSEFGSSTEVSASMSASTLVSTLESALNTELDDDSAVDFVAALNEAFVNSQEYSLPAYKSAQYGTEMATTLEEVEELVMDNGEFDNNNLVFVLSTDLHTDVSSNKRWDESASNQKKFIDLATAAGIDINSVVCLGDFTEGKYSSTHTYDNKTGLDALKQYVEDNINPQFKALNKPLLFAIGNHDNNVDSGSYACMSRKEIYDLYLKDMVDYDEANWITVDGNTFFHEYYKDFEDYNIRVVVLDSNRANDTNTYSTNDKNWLYPPSSAEYLGKMFGVDAGDNALSDNENTDMMPNGYKLIILSHIHFQSCASWGSEQASQVINLLKNHRDKILCMFAGHKHKDIVVGFPMPAVLVGCNKFEGSGSEVAGDNDVKYTVPARNKSNATADLWDVVVINKTQDIINFIRFGAGYNRRLHTDYLTVDVGDTLTLTPSIATGSGYNWAVQTSVTYKNSNASIENNSSLISVSNGVVEVLEASQTFDRYVVWAANADDSWREYWCIEVNSVNS